MPRGWIGLMLAAACASALDVPRGAILRAPLAVGAAAAAPAAARAPFLEVRSCCPAAPPLCVADSPRQSVPTETEMPRPRAAPAVPRDEGVNARVVEAQTRALDRGPGDRTGATDRVAMDVRVARTDGTFSLRPDDPDPPITGRLVLGLFGEETPAAAALFLT